MVIYSSDRKKLLKEVIAAAQRAHYGDLVRGVKMEASEDAIRRHEARRKMENLRDLREIEKLAVAHRKSTLSVST